MAVATSYKPEGAHSITPYLTVAGAAKAIEFYKQAFGAVELSRMGDPTGTIMHAEIRIGDSLLYLCDEFPQMGARGPKSIGGTPVNLHLAVPDCDSVFRQATSAGATAKRPPEDMFWGDRYAQIEDPFGHLWGIATTKEKLTHEEVMERAKKSMANQG